jgi:hypothetical protein
MTDRWIKIFLMALILFILLIHCQFFTYLTILKIECVEFSLGRTEQNKANQFIMKPNVKISTLGFSGSYANST